MTSSEPPAPSCLDIVRRNAASEAKYKFCSQHLSRRYAALLRASWLLSAQGLGLIVLTVVALHFVGGALPPRKSWTVLILGVVSGIWLTLFPLIDALIIKRRLYQRSVKIIVETEPVELGLKITTRKAVSRPLAEPLMITLDCGGSPLLEKARNTIWEADNIENIRRHHPELFADPVKSLVWLDPSDGRPLGLFADGAVFWLI